jgi:ribonuclease P protein component
VQRLKTRSQFQAVMDGSTVARTAHFALHRLALQPASDGGSPATGPGSEGSQALFVVHDAWIGALVPKRWARRAVTRNTIKRQIYAVSAQLEDQLPQAAHVVRLRTAFDRATYPSATSEPLKRVVRGELEQLFARAARPASAARVTP